MAMKELEVVQMKNNMALPLLSLFPLFLSVPNSTLGSPRKLPLLMPSEGTFYWGKSCVHVMPT